MWMTNSFLSYQNADPTGIKIIGGSISEKVKITVFNPF